MTGPATVLGVLAAASFALAFSSPSWALSRQLSDWRTLQSEEFGYMIAYPGSVFEPDAQRSSDGGHVLVSRDGQAKLLVATFENEDNATLEEYRQQLIEDNYAGADLDFAPVRKRWFVLSGTQGDTHFYYRVSFTCGGRLINSWALIYPNAERRLYDRIVEGVAKSYTPGAGRTGDCD